MPSDSSLKAFLSSLSPEDVATLFAGLRNTLPIGMGVYSPELNAGEAEVIAKRQAERDAARAREMEILSRLLPQAMAKRAAPVTQPEPDLFVPTRPRIMRESPFMFTQPQMSRVPQQYATGGGVLADQTMPDMSDGGQMITDPQPFAGGGGVFGKKSLDEMQAELLSKEGLSRRALFGLKPDYPLTKTPEPLSKVEQEVKRAEQAARKQGQAPSVTASRVDVDPGTGRKKSLMESVTETPVSRRTVLKTAGSQVAQNVLPMGDLMKLAGAPAVTSPVGAIAQATQSAMPLVPMTVQGLIARAAKMGLDEDQTIALLEKMGAASADDVQYMLPVMRKPYDFYEDLGVEQMSRAKAMANLINEDLTRPMAMRGPLREIKRENPDMYKELKQAAQDIYDYGQEF